MNVVAIELGLKLLVTVSTAWRVEAISSGVSNDWVQSAPSVLREVIVSYWCSFHEVKVSSLHRYLKCFTQKNVDLQILVSEGVKWILIEEWFKEWTSLEGKVEEATVVVLHVVISVNKGGSDYIVVPHWGVWTWNGSIESVWLLRFWSVLVVVSSEWIQWSENVPSGTEFVSSVTVETANIWTHEWQGEQVVTEDTVNWECHVLNCGPVITHPMVTIFTETWEVRSWQNVWSLVNADQVLSCGLGLHQWEQVVNVILSSVNGIMPSIDTNGFVLEVSPAWDIEGLVSVWVGGSLLWLAVAIAEVSSFILVEPDTIEDQTIVISEALEVSLPPVNSWGLEEIGEISVTAPYTSSQVVLMVVLLNENVISDTLIKSIVTLVESDSDSCVHNGHELNALLFLDLLYVFR